jgi:hypothetical protein
MQATRYNGFGGQLQRMATRIGPLSLETWSAIQQNGNRLLEARGMKPVDIARRKDGTVDKTPYNILTGANPPKLQSLEKLAASLEVPLWVLMIPGIPDHLCNDAGLRSIEKLVTDFSHCELEDRTRISNLADAVAPRPRKS